MIEAVIFDMDGLLIDSETLWQSAQVTALKTVGIEPKKGDFQHVLGLGLHGTVEWWYHRQPWRGPSRRDIERLIEDEFLKLFKRKGRLRPGAKEVLEFFDEQGLPMAIASSTALEIVNMITETLGIKVYFKVICSGVHEPYHKPHPGIFITAARQLNADPRHCLVFEDAPSGVLAAKAAMMKCVAVPEPENKDNKFIRSADVVLGSLEEFDEAMLARLSLG
jgi:mannitol-1-/sugar-/sorbitol-6-/2-deoxyglucose-6-phosphatase